MRIVFDSQFQADLKQVLRRDPHIREELQDLILYIEELGDVPPGYRGHLLTHSRKTYTGYFALHLQEGKKDLVLIYHHLQKGSSFRFVRLGSHKDLFQGREL